MIPHALVKRIRLLVVLLGLTASCSAPEIPGEDGGSPEVCGGLRGLGCGRGEFCNFPEEAMCGAADQTGTCEAIPELCSDLYQPVCGCDDKTYVNACHAHAQSVSVARQGECDPAPVNCDLRQVVCKRFQPACPDMQVPEVVNGCYGACVPIDACVCDEPEDCSNTDAYTCFKYKGRCGPYVE